jgi:hypothetical protein
MIFMEYEFIKPKKLSKEKFQFFYSTIKKKGVYYVDLESYQKQDKNNFSYKTINITDSKKENSISRKDLEKYLISIEFKKKYNYNSFLNYRINKVIEKYKKEEIKKNHNNIDILA